MFNLSRTQSQVFRAVGVLAVGICLNIALALAAKKVVFNLASNPTLRNALERYCDYSHRQALTGYGGGF